MEIEKYLIFTATKPHARFKTLVALLYLNVIIYILNITLNNIHNIK